MHSQIHPSHCPPLQPLTPLQRLAYLDAHPTITCHTDFPAPQPSSVLCPPSSVPSLPPSPSDCPTLRPFDRPYFRSGESYLVRTLPVSVTRRTWKLNHAGVPTLVDTHSLDHAILVTAADTIERTFLDARHRHPDTYVIPFDPDDPPDPEDLPPPLPIHYTLQDLLAHFIIPDVPDVVAMHTSQYQAHLDAIARIQRTCFREHTPSPSPMGRTQPTARLHSRPQLRASRWSSGPPAHRG